MMSEHLETLQDARAHASALHIAWWNLYTKSKDSPETAEAHTASKSFHEAVLAKFGKSHSKYPDCRECISVSVFGGPRHEASKNCKSGKHNHCSCDTCF
jgi:hypothetical protein